MQGRLRPKLLLIPVGNVTATSHVCFAGGLLSAGLLLPKGAEADDAGYKPEEKKLIAVKYLSSFQRNDQKQAVIVSPLVSY